MLPRISIRGHARELARRPVRRFPRWSVRRPDAQSVPSYFKTTNITIFEREKLMPDIINNGTMIDDEEVASDVLPQISIHPFI